MIPEAAQRAAEAAYTEKLVELRLSEGGGFKAASQQRRAIASALEAAAPHMLAEAWDAVAADIRHDSAIDQRIYVANRVRNSNPYRTAK